MEEVDQIFDLIWLKNISESGHSGPAIVDLMLDLLFL